MFRSKRKLIVVVAGSILFGALLAATFTDIQRPCGSSRTAIEESYCVEFSKAVMSPGDFANDSTAMQHFAVTFALGAAIFFVASTLIVRRRPKW